MAFLVSGVEMLFGLVPFRTSPLFALMFVSPLSFFCCLVCSTTTFFSLSLSLRCWGNPSPFWGLGFPLCQDFRFSYRKCGPGIVFFFVNANSVSIFYDVFSAPLEGHFPKCIFGNPKKMPTNYPGNANQKKPFVQHGSGSSAPNTSSGAKDISVQTLFAEGLHSWTCSACNEKTGLGHAGEQKKIGKKGSHYQVFC